MAQFVKYYSANIKSEFDLQDSYNIVFLPQGRARQLISQY